MLPIFISAISDVADRCFAETLYYEHKAKIYKAAYKILNNAEDAEDVTSETFIKIMDKLQEYHDKSDDELASIFITIAKNLAKNKYNRQNNIEFIPISEADVSEEYSDSVGDYIIKEESYEILYKAVEMLDREYAQVVKLKLGYDYSDKQIGEILDMSDANVRVRYHRAKKMLAKYLKGDSENGKK
jgi:RNA polymerase sigma-70 factor (ECF subfamily)